MIETKLFTPTNKLSINKKAEIVEFLHNHLEEYGDLPSDIENAINYATKEISSFGGFVLISLQHNEITGVVVVNQTGMKGYIPENILVYIATHKDHRGKGIGKELMQKTIQLAHGNIALHVEPDNPARFLYKKYGFTNKYIEMRLQQPAN